MRRPMREIRSQASGGGRWFQGESLDVFVWQADDGAIDALQMIFFEAGGDQVLLWDALAGVRFAAVDDGIQPGSYPRSPMLEPAAPFDLRAALLAFDLEAVHIDAKVRDFILELLRAEGDRQARTYAGA